MKTFTKHFFLILTFIMIMFSGCKKKKDNPSPSDPVNPNDQELITTLKISSTDQANPAGPVIETVFKDTDGDGGNGPVQFDTLRLSPNTTYDNIILLLDETKSPADTISNEVQEEGDEHQFFYTFQAAPSSSATLTVSYIAGDTDSHGVPIGLSPRFQTGAQTGLGSLTVILKHQPGVKPTSGNGNVNLGETDIEVVFPVKIQ